MTIASDVNEIKSEVENKIKDVKKEVEGIDVPTTEIGTIGYDVKESVKDTIQALEP